LAKNEKQKYQILFTAASAAHIKKITDWYNRQSPGLGNRFKPNLRKRLEQIREHPFTPSFRYDNVRFCIPDKFPYAAHYTVDEASGKIIVHAVFGFKENPGKWLHE
jgi:hypothetical protein